MVGDLTRLLWPAGHPGTLRMRRAEAIVSRVRAFSLIFSGLTLAWIPVDAAIFGAPSWHALASVRAMAAIALLALALSCAPRGAAPLQASIRLLALFALPAAFYAATLHVLQDLPGEAMGAAAAAAYSFMPVLMAAGISAFPLTALESFSMGGFALLAEAWGFEARGIERSDYAGLDRFWLLLLIALVASFAAMSQLRLLDELVRQAVRDPLTGCLRRESGKELLDAQMLLAARHRAPLTAMFADIDRFKAVNDDFGHEAGDRVLAQVAERLRAALRESDVLVRWGGEEFLMVLPDAESSEALALVDRLRASGFGRLQDGRPVTISIGVAEARRDGADTSVALVALADRRMYAAKQAGRNRLVAGPAGEAVVILAAAA